MSPTWSPAQYGKFADERLRPALDLLARVPLDAPGVVCDLGCGSGEVTRLLAERWPAARVVGLDSSPEMLERARSGPAGIEWVEGAIEQWAPDEPVDLVYSNAALHWVDDHRPLMRRLAAAVREGGCLAIQMPLSQDLPSHRLMRETLADGGPSGEPLGDAALRQAVARRRVEDAVVYHDLLADRAARLDIWETQYLHVLEGEDPVLEWVRGTGLRPVLEGLDDSERAAFLDEYPRRLRVAYPRRPDGRTLYPFRRLFVVAVMGTRPRR